MATIRKQLTLKEATGTKVPGILPAIPIATFDMNEINTLLAGTTPVPEGIRFHFEKAPDNSTAGLIAVSLGVKLMPSPAGGTTVMNVEITSGTKRYLWRGTESRDLTQEQYRTQFPTQADKATSRDGISNACVFFSRLDLKEVLAQDGATHIAFFPQRLTRTFTTIEETFDTLVAVGLNRAGTALDIKIMSELPCPPHCGDDYPPQ
jgi:hypothetical protein